MFSGDVLPEDGPVISVDALAKAKMSGKLKLTNRRLDEIPSQVLKLYKTDTPGVNWWEAVVMTFLDISHNKLTTLPRELFEAFDKLKILRATGNELASVSKEVASLEELAVLDLSRNALDTVQSFIHKRPSGLPFFPALTKLVLSGNNLRALPKSICNISTLNTLDVQRNQLEKLPVALGKLDLVQLIATENDLRSLPRSIGLMKRLHTLEVRQNKLTSVPDTLELCDELASVDFSQNQLEAVPRLRSPKLRTLLLAHNSIRNADALAFLSPALETLIICSNRLDALPNVFGRFQQLASFDVGANSLQALPSSLGYCAALKSLNSSANRIRSLNQAGQRGGSGGTAVLLTTLRERAQGEGFSLEDAVAAGETPTGVALAVCAPLDDAEDSDTDPEIDEDEQEQEEQAAGAAAAAAAAAAPKKPAAPQPRKPKVQKHRRAFHAPAPYAVPAAAKAPSRNAMAVWQPVHSRVSSRGVFDARNLKLAELDDAAFQVPDASRVQSVLLASNALTALPWAMAKFATSLRTLDLSHNKLQELPAVVCDLRALQTLDLTRNRLKALPEQLRMLEKLTTLTLASNMLTELPACLRFLPALRELDASHNQVTSLAALFPRDGRRDRALTSVKLISNKIDAVTVDDALGIRRCARLTAVDLDHNEIKLLPAELGACSQLTAFLVRNNEITNARRNLIERGGRAVLDFLKGQLPADSKIAGRVADDDWTDDDEPVWQLVLPGQPEKEQPAAAAAAASAAAPAKAAAGAATPAAAAKAAATPAPKVAPTATPAAAAVAKPTPTTSSAAGGVAGAAPTAPAQPEVSKLDEMKKSLAELEARRRRRGLDAAARQQLQKEISKLEMGIARESRK